MEITEHGGECCGISHVYGFGPEPNDGRIKDLKAYIKHSADFIERTVEAYNPQTGDYYEKDAFPGVETLGHVIEVALTDDQMVAGWAKELKKLGFSKPFRALNDNSGNYVNVSLLRTRRTKDKAPYKW